MNFFQRFTFLFSAPMFDADDLEGLRVNQIVTAIERMGFQVIKAPQVEALGSVVEFNHLRAGRLRQMRNAARFEKTPAAIRRGAPALGEQSDEILAEAGYTPAEIAGLRADGVIR